MALLDRLQKPTALFPADFSDARCTPLVPFMLFIFFAFCAFELAIASCTPLVPLN